MSQEYTRRQRRANRGRANRPVLVTSSDTTQSTASEQQELATSPVATETATNVTESELRNVPSVPSPAPTGQRKLPRFFSTVSKGEQESQTSTAREQTIAQARIARATRGKAVATPAAQTTSTSETPKEKTVAKPATQTTARPAANARPAQTGFFKTRYIIGLGIYLLVADFVGVYEAQLLTQFGLEQRLAQFSLFGLPIQVRTSTIVFLATLVLVLVVLAYFDLLPRSLSSATNRGTTGTNRTTSSNSSAERTPQPTVRQGIKGADDDLYQAYRANQRRERKR